MVFDPFPIVFKSLSYKRFFQSYSRVVQGTFTSILFDIDFYCFEKLLPIISDNSTHIHSPLVVFEWLPFLLLFHKSYGAKTEKIFETVL